MKKLIIALLIPILTFAQKDSVKIKFEEEKGELKQATFVDDAAYFQMLQEPIKQLWKLNIGSTPNSRSESGNLEHNISLGYERILTKAFSINVTADYWSKGEGFIRKTGSLIVEPRLYLNSNNGGLKGPYFGLKFQQYLNQREESSRVLTHFKQHIGLTYGLQNRFLRNGLLDLGITAGLEANNQLTPVWQKRNDGGPYYNFTGRYNKTNILSWFLRSEARVGIGFSGTKSRYKPTSCDVFRCNEAQKNWLKIDATRMFYFSNQKRELDLRLDYEFKIAASAWSINQGLRIGYNYYFENQSSYSSSGFSDGIVSANSWYGEYHFEPRYYYGLKKRMAYGKSANNLSANYIALTNGFDVYEREKGYEIERIDTGLLWGMQRRLVRNAFFDTSGGIAKTLDGSWVDGLFPNDSGLFFILNFKVGYAF